MLAQQIYSKEEISKELGRKYEKTSNLTRDLKAMGYEFETSGRGSTYRIKITKLPVLGIRDFAKKYLGIAAYKEELADFLYILFALDDGEDYLDWSYRCLTEIISADHKTIKGWMDALVECGLVNEDKDDYFYYATYKEDLTWPNGEFKYESIRLIKTISKEEYGVAADAYRKHCEEQMKDIKINANKIKSEIEFYGRCIRKRALDGWWACYSNCRRTVNALWEHYDELIELLRKHNLNEFQRIHPRDAEKEFEEQMAREIMWAKEKEEKAKKLLEDVLAETKAEIREQYAVDGTVNWAAAMKEEILNSSAVISDFGKDTISPEIFTVEQIVINSDKQKVNDVYEWIDFVKNNVQIVSAEIKDRKLKDNSDKRTALLVADGMFTEENMIPFLEIYAGGVKIPGYTPKVDLMMKSIKRKWMVDIYVADGVLRIEDKAPAAIFQ